VAGTLIGEVRVVDDVAGAFVTLVEQAAPTTLALSGGATAERCYTRLRDAEDVDWSRVEVLLGDERWVPVDHPDSNEGMIRRVLADHVAIGSVYSMARAAADISDAAIAYEAVIKGLPDGIDVIHLGLGPDGHTASLFPGNPALDERDRLVLATGDDAHPHPRLTITFPVIEAAGLVVVTVEGDAKREAFARVQAGDDVPAARIRGERVIWLVDPAAAGTPATGDRA
jgi:6-phosphogluconolactonase